MIDGVADLELITDPGDQRVADFRDLVAGDRRPGTQRGTGPVIVEGVPAVERLLASPYPVRTVIGVPGRLAALDLPAGGGCLRGRKGGAVGADRLPADPGRAGLRRPAGPAGPGHTAHRAGPDRA